MTPRQRLPEVSDGQFRALQGERPYLGRIRPVMLPGTPPPHVISRPRPKSDMACST